MMLPIKSEMLSKIHSMLCRNLVSNGSACLGDAMLSYQTSKIQKLEESPHGSAACSFGCIWETGCWDDADSEGFELRSTKDSIPQQLLC